MSDRHMRFCASTSKCASAYSVGSPGTVKIAHDSAPVDESQINEVLAFLAHKLSDEDYAQVADMLDAVVDKAEDLNPTKAMAADGLSSPTRRILRRIRRDTKLGYDARPAGLAADAATVKAVLPHHGRLGSGGSIGYAQPMTPKPSRPARAADMAEAEAMFPNMKRLG